MLMNVSDFVSAIFSAKAEKYAFEAYCKTLSPEDAKKAIEERKNRFEEERKIANASRPCNFSE